MTTPRRIVVSFLTLLCLVLFNPVESYRLNVPRVLLPYHPTIPVKFTLEVSQPTGGCFNWRSTRPDVVAVSPLGARPGQCSDRAEIRATAKAATGELTAVIFAEDKSSGTTLSCGVSVDQVAKIHIETTTKVLFVDAAPVRMIVEAFNKEGDHFSTLSEIPIDWELVHSGGDRPLRIVPFEQSTYEAPSDIMSLEKQKKKGYVILVEGVITGSAVLTAKFNDQFLGDIDHHSLDLTVVANLLLIPAYDLYVPVHSTIPFQVLIVKQHSTEVVPMPSSSYYLQVDAATICSLDVATSSVYAESRGRTDIHLLSHNVDVKAKTGVRPPSTSINVVDPETLQWGVSGDNWLLQTGNRYVLQVSLLDPHGNTMFIGDNLRFESILHLDHFDVHEASENQTHYVVTPKKTGKTVLKSKFVAVLTKNGKEERVVGKVHGEQTVHIVDPVTIRPHSVALPYMPRVRTNYQLQASGGSGLYDWSVDDATVCGVDVTSGVLSSGALGTTKVTAADRRNNAHYDVAEVSVLEVHSLSFGSTVKEAVVGDILVLNVQLYGSGPNGPVPFHDCRAMQWQIQSADRTVFDPVKDAVIGLPTVGTGCATVTLRAKSSGDTKVTVSMDHLRATVDVSAYPSLKLSVNDIAMAVGSDLNVKFDGGARPWILEPVNHFKTANSADDVSASVNDDSAIFTCSNTESSSTITVRVGNRPSTSLPLPLVTETVVNVCCARPSRLSILSPRDPRLSKCHSSAKIMLATSTAHLSLSGYGSCNEVDRLLDSITGLEVKWSSNSRSLIDIDTKKDGSNTSPVVIGNGAVGDTVLTAEVSSIRKHGKLPNSIKAAIDLRLVKRASAEPKTLILWNEAVAKTDVVLTGGSGQFYVADSNGSPYKADVHGYRITVIPRAQGAGVLRVVDACLLDEEIDVPVKISDISSLVVRGPKYVEVGSEIEVHVIAADESGSSFSQYHGALADSKLETSNANVKIIRRDGDRYVLRAETVGAVSLSASARSSSGRRLSSHSHSVQVFSPISLHPKRITLIPESTFQLEVLGGPQPTPPIEFALNNTKIVNIEPNALITSQTLGYTAIIGTVNVASGHVTKDTVIVHVVSLAGIRIVASTQRAERGGRVWLRLQGLDQDETPFSFGGALHPFKVTWSVSHPEVLRNVHPLGASITETYANRYAVWLDAHTAGSATITVKVELAAGAKQHFSGSHRFFQSSLDVRVEEPLSLRRPEVPLGIVRVAPNSRLQLETAWPESSVEFSVPSQYANRLSVSPTGLLSSHHYEGAAAIAVRRTDASDNETSLIPVAVSPVHSLDVHSSTQLDSSSEIPLYHLPVGVVITLHVTFRDSKGRALHAGPNALAYRPHRFDLTEIVGSAENHTLTVTIKTAGETVLKIWDSSSPSIFVFIRLSAAESLLPAGKIPLVSDILCLRSPLAGNTHWFSSDNTNAVQWIDAERGVARLLHAGTTHVTARTDSQSLHTKLTIGSSRQLVFTEDVPQLVSNVEGISYVFAIGAQSNYSLGSNDCTDEQREVLSNIRPPIDCSVSFVSSKSSLPPAVNLLSAKAIYIPATGSYACLVERQMAGTVHLNIADAVETEMSVTAKWRSDSQQQEASTKTKFHLAMDVIEKELQLSDVDRPSSVLSMLVPPYQSSYVSAVGCDVVSVSETRNPHPERTNSVANKFFLVKLNVKSAAVWSELSNICSVTVENSVTGQKVVVPVRVRLVGQAGKLVYNALDSNGFIDFVLIFMQRFSWIIPSLMGACLIGILGIGGYWFVTQRLLQKSGVYGDESMLSSRANVSQSAVSPNSSLYTSYQGSPGVYRDSPIFKTSSSSPRLGSRGDGLWTTSSGSDMKRRH